MADTFTNKDIKEHMGLSPAGIRNYCQVYARYLSTEATPAPGLTRRFTLSDMKLFAYVRQRTNEGATHIQIEPEIAAGALASFEWELPTKQKTARPGPVEEPEEPTTALVPASALAAYQTLLQATEKRLETTDSELSQARSRIEQLQSELGKAQGISETLASQNARLTRSWWRKLLGLD